MRYTKWPRVQIFRGPTSVSDSSPSTINTTLKVYKYVPDITTFCLFLHLHIAMMTSTVPGKDTYLKRKDTSQYYESPDLR
jgi:hypothetical protein